MPAVTCAAVLGPEELRDETRGVDGAETTRRTEGNMMGVAAL